MRPRIDGAICSREAEISCRFRLARQPRTMNWVSVAGIASGHRSESFLVFNIPRRITAQGLCDIQR